MLQIMILSTALPLVAGRFGLAPTALRNASAGLKLSDNKVAGLYSNDPAGTWTSDLVFFLPPRFSPYNIQYNTHSRNCIPIIAIAGFTAVDVLALGALGHVIGVGTVLGLKATGNL